MRYGIIPPKPLPTDDLDIGPGVPIDANRSMFRRIVRLVRGGRVVREVAVDVVAGTTPAEAAEMALERMTAA